MKGIIAFLMVAGIAGTVFAQNIDVASIDTHARLEILKKAAQPVVTETYVYYDISGDNANEMRRQMTANGVKWDDGRTYDALTTWNVNWTYDYNCSLAGCTADSFKPTVGITFRYPRWVQPETASPELVQRWQTYMKNLIMHENGHRDMAVRETADLAQAVAQLPPTPSRAELDRAIEAVANERMAKMNADEKEYDATTIHGTTQGAVFP